MGYIGWLIIPAISLYMPIGVLFVSGGTWDTTTLEYGLAHLDGMTWGRFDAGRTAIAGHSWGGFKDLAQVQVGDEVVLVPNNAKAQALVVWRIDIVPVSDVSLFTTPTDEWELVLITCEGDFRRIVRARLK